MNVVITVEKFDSFKGYLEYYLARELCTRGHHVFVFTFGATNQITEDKFEEGFELIRIPRLLSFGGLSLPNIQGIAYVSKFIRIQKPNVIHCQPLFSPLSLAFIGCKHLSSSKVVGSLITGGYTIDSIIARFRYYFAKLVTEYFVKNRTAIFFVIDENWKRIALNLFKIPRLKIREIPLGADSELFKPDSQARKKMRNQLGLSQNDLVVVYSGKFSRSKKLHVLLEAITPLIKQNTRIKLLLVGRGDSIYQKYLKEISLRNGISGNVVFHNWVPRTRLPDFYNASDIAVWPGSVSISIIEAASTGLPLIVKHSTITKNVISNGNGLTYEPDNIEKLRQRLEELLTDKDLRKAMGKKSRLLVEKKLNWKSITSQYLKAYQNLL